VPKTGQNQVVKRRTAQSESTR